jgi:hypothetical protein
MRRTGTWRRRTTVAVAFGAIVVAGALGGQAAAAPKAQACPSGFVGTAPDKDFGDTGLAVDKNGNDLVCFKRTGNPNGNIVDDKILGTPEE